MNSAEKKTIGILYESHEWSTYQLEKEFASLGFEVLLFDTEQEISKERLKECDCIVNRVFASAQFRGHNHSLAIMPELLNWIDQEHILLINPSAAHAYEVSKTTSTLTLEKLGFPVPKVYATIQPNDTLRKEQLQFPCIVKPDCGGRTNATCIASGYSDVEKMRSENPTVTFIIEEYIPTTYGFITRIEVIGDECALIVKRSVTENGLSAYHLGSKYEVYTDCREELQRTAVAAMKALSIEIGSMDVIENENGFYFIDINAVSNTSEDCTELFSFDQMKETAAHIAKLCRA